jgi:hypothetical protein
MGASLGASFEMRACRAVPARYRSKGNGDDAVATGAFPDRTYRTARHGRRTIPITRPITKVFIGVETLKRF